MLEVISVEKAIEILSENFGENISSETLKTENIPGRILSEDVYSRENIPAFHRSTVDGFAVISSDTYGAGENMPSMLGIKGEILMGQKPTEKISRGECMKISTGGMLPEGADSVVMVEYTDLAFEGMCLCMKAVSSGENVTKKGDDVKEGSVILKKGRKLSSADAGILAATGITEVKCAKKPLVGIISTGDEIIDYSLKPSIGQIRDINSVLISSLLRENGCETKSYGIVRDNKRELTEVFLRALSECDTVLLSGGSSKGERDMTAEIISERGELLFHGLAMKPGKPTILGACDKKAVFGLPGHPAAAYYVCQRLVIPFIKMLTGDKEKIRTVRLTLGTDIPSNHGREDVVSVKISEGKIYPVFGKSGLVSILSESDGYIIIERNREGAFLGEETEVYFTS